MNRGRLQLAIDILENLELPANSEFDMWAWGCHHNDHIPEKNNYCGTVACALGWLSLDKRINKQGLYAAWKVAVNNKIETVCMLTPSYVHEGKLMTEVEAAACFFEIPLDHAYGFFLPSWYYSMEITPQMVAERMRDYLKGVIIGGM